MHHVIRFGIGILCCILIGGCGASTETVMPEDPVAPASKEDVEKNIAAGRDRIAQERKNGGKSRGSSQPD